MTRTSEKEKQEGTCGKRNKIKGENTRKTTERERERARERERERDRER